jgi:tetratricopeptide (TPR) repeat protein
LINHLAPEGLPQVAEAGQPVLLRTGPSTSAVTIQKPSGATERFPGGTAIVFANTEEAGRYQVSEAAVGGGAPRQRSFTVNAGSDTEKARVLFVEAWEQAQVTHQEDLAVDAAHMVAITYAGTLDAIAWNQRGLVLARPSQSPKARALIPAMLNNSAWDLHEMGRFSDALALFGEAQAEWVARGKPEQIQAARWAVARCLRSLGRYDEALAIQRALEADHTATGSADGYVFEEIAENLAALGKPAEAKPYFGKAVAELRKDDWFVTNEAARLANLISRAGTL